MPKEHFICVDNRIAGKKTATAEEKDVAFELMRLALTCVKDYNDHKDDYPLMEKVFYNKWQIHHARFFPVEDTYQRLSYKFLDLIEKLTEEALQYANQSR